MSGFELSDNCRRYRHRQDVPSGRSPSLATLRKGSQSYSVEIVLEIEERTGREVATAAVLVALRRLKDKDYLEDQWLEPGTYGAHGRRYFSLTAKALEEMSGARQRYLSLWDGLESVLDDAVGGGS